MSQTLNREVDVVVVGGATTGLYFGGLMAGQGKRVLICDSASAESLGSTFDIIHIAQEHFERFGLKEPVEGDEAYVSHFCRSVQKSAHDNWPKNSYCETLVLRRVPLVKRILDWALEQGAEVMLETSFEQAIFDEAGKLCGALFTQGNGDRLAVKSRLVADASGIPAVVRTALPDGYGMENFVCTPRDQFYVILHYARLADPERDHIDTTTTWTHYKIWLAPQHGSNGAIMGVGANLCFDYAERVYQRFLTKGFMPAHTLEYIEQGSTPYCRIPYSLVADGFVALGSAACISNPWSGEGVPYSWLECMIAAKICKQAMAKGAYPSQESLWQINALYHREQGALFAKNLAMLSGATACTENENDYEYQKGIIYENHDENGNSTERGTMIAKLIKGLLRGKISLGTLGRLMAASSIGGKIEKHYLNYPITPLQLDEWITQADALWAKAGSMADVAEADLAAMLSEADLAAMLAEESANPSGKAEEG